MTNTPSFFERANNWLKQSITIRLFIIAVLILLLLIPVSMVEHLIGEREERQKDAIREVSAKWGERQTVTGLVLSVPYWSYTKVYEDDQSQKYKIVQTKQYAHFLPDELQIEGDVAPEMRYRGIYEVIVYNSKLNVKGSFSRPDFEAWKIEDKDIIWEEATVSLGLSDLRSIQENIAVTWNKQNYYFNPGLESFDVMKTGISSRIPKSALMESEKYDFSMKLNFNGSSSLDFVPLGKVSKVMVRSAWKNPSFNGAFLPDTRDITPDGFTAQWEVLHLNRIYPQSFTGAVAGVEESAFGVDLIVPVDDYQKSMRSAKYAVIFITLTFLIFFFVQILLGVRIHPIQYIIVGLALCVFYTLLIALSEHIAFKLSYLISALAIVGMITLYAKAMFNNQRLTLLIGCILAGLYLFIYTIIQLEDYALLMGSIGLFLVLATIMYLSRKINWYAIQSKEQP